MSRDLSPDDPRENPTDQASPVDLANLADLAAELALGAARLIREQLGLGPESSGPAVSLEITSKSTDTDVVTHVDRLVEEWLLAELAQQRPADAILAEEGGAHPPAVDASDGGSSPAVRWVIDPIDGTVNFVRGLPRFAVSIAAEVAGEVRVGCVLNPVTGDLFWATQGGGGWRRRLGRDYLDGRDPVPGRQLRDSADRLTGPPRRALALKVVATGFGYDAARRVRQVAVVAGLISQVADIRRLGAASLDLCSVAAGEVDAYYEVGLSPWDYAAGALIAAEAGCVVTGLRGRSVSRVMTAACAEPSAPFFELLEELEADSVLEPGSA